MAQSTRQVAVGTNATSLLWQTSTGVPPDPKTALAGGTTGVFRAGTFNDPLRIIIDNLDASNPVYVGDSAVTSGTGTPIVKGGQLVLEVVGNDSMYAISTGGTVAVSVTVGRQ